VTDRKRDPEAERLEAVLALAIEGEPSVIVPSELEVPTASEAVAARARAATREQRELAHALQREAEAAMAALRAAIGEDAARYFIRRLEDLERRIRDLETRY
jgi:hypothetical protein